MGGQDGIRGYLVQAIIAVLESLSQDNWEFVALEPDETNEKVDIQWWDADGQASVYQVKSSINNFDKGGILGVLNDLVNDAPYAAHYTVALIGTYSGDTVKFFTAFQKQDKADFGKFASLFDSKEKITISLKALDISGLFGQIESKVHAFLSGRGYIVPHPVIELIALGLSTQFTRFATDGTKVTKAEFQENILNWMRYNYPKELRKENERLLLASYADNQVNTTGDYKSNSKLDDKLLDDNFNQQIAEILLLIGDIDQVKLPVSVTETDLHNPNRITFITVLPIGGDLPAFMGADEIVKMREQVLNFLQTDLPVDFFNVGQAKRPQMKTIMDFMGHGPRFIGSSDEVKKAELLADLKWKLNRLTDLNDCWRELCSYNVLPFVMFNDGEGLQSNIELQLSFPDSVKVLQKESFPKLNYNSNLELFSYKAGILQTIFILPSDSLVNKYDYREIPPMDLMTFDPFYGKRREDYEWPFNQTLQWVFDYKIYHNIQGQQILSCLFKAIKPKNAMVLPSLILYKSDVDFEISYHFKSDQSGTTKGVLKIKRG